jgi:hypothetical protein
MKKYRCCYITGHKELTENMFEDILNPKVEDTGFKIELYVGNGQWMGISFSTLKKGDTFRYVEDRDRMFSAGGDPFKTNGKWTVLGTEVTGTKLK